MLFDNTGIKSEVGRTVAVRVCTIDDLIELRHCGVSGVRGMANGNEEGTNSVDVVRENNTTSDL